MEVFVEQGVIIIDLLLQAIGARHSAVFQPPVTDVTLSQEDFPIHYSAEMRNQSNLSPSSSTSSLHEPNQRQTSTDHDDQKVPTMQQNGFNPAEEDPPSITSPVESVHDPASDSSFTSQDTIIVMTKEILKGNMSPFDENMDDEEFGCQKHATSDPSCSDCADNLRSCTPASDSSIGRFRIVSLTSDDLKLPISDVPHHVPEESCEELGEDVKSEETKIQPESKPVCSQSELECSSASPIDSSIGRFHVVNFTQELSIEPVVPVMQVLDTGVQNVTKKKAPPPPPAKPSMAVLRQRMSNLNQTSTESEIQTSAPVTSDAKPQPPTRSGSVPNSLVSVSEIRKTFERRTTSLDSQSAPVSSPQSESVPVLRSENQGMSGVSTSTGGHPIDPSVSHRCPERSDKRPDLQFPVTVREQRPKSFPSDATSSTSSHAGQFESLNQLEHVSIKVKAPNSAKSSEPQQLTQLEQKKRTSVSGSEKSEASDSTSSAELVEYTAEPRTLVPSKRTSSLANFHSVPGTACSQPSPSMTRIVNPQPVYLSLNRRDPHQLLTLCNAPYCSHATVTGQMQPPVRTGASAAPPLPPPRPVRGQNVQGQSVPTPSPRPIFLQQQQLIQTPAGLVSPSAIYGYIRNCSAQSASGNHIHYHHPQLVLQAASQKLRSCEEFPPANEIRRRDGINAFPQVWQEAPSPGKLPISSVPDQSDELEQFVQQAQDRTQRIKQRYSHIDDESSDDPTFGFSNRPSVRGIRGQQQPRATLLPVAGAPGQVLVQPIDFAAYQQQRMAQMGHPVNQGSPGQPVPPSRHVYLVRAPHYSAIVPVGATLPRLTAAGHNLTMMRPPQPNERPASSLGPMSLDVHTGCPQCSLIHQRQRVEQMAADAGAEQQVVYPVQVQNGPALTYKTISMPNVAMIRPVGLLSMVPNQRTNGAPPTSSNDQAATAPVPQPRSTSTKVTSGMSASATAMAMTSHKTQVHNNNPDLVIDATMSRKPAQAAGSSPMPSSSSNASSSSSSLMPAPFHAKKDGRSKDDKKKCKKDKDKRKQPKDGPLYYSMNL